MGAQDKAKGKKTPEGVVDHLTARQAANLGGALRRIIKEIDQQDLVGAAKDRWLVLGDQRRSSLLDGLGAPILVPMIEEE